VTLSIVEEGWEIAGVAGPKYKVGPYCAHPTCSRVAEHVHHMYRRSKEQKSYDWVEIRGVPYGNLTGLCVEHHLAVSGRIGGHKAAIRFIEGVFWWCTVAGRKPNGERIFMPERPLDPQPPTPEQVASRASEQEDSPESELCPACGQKKRRRRVQAGSRRRRSWCIRVPDEAEDGAGIIDVLVDDLAPLLRVEPSQTGRYYVIVPVLVYAQQNKRDFIESIAGR
jgi:hypothetical protein